MIPLHWNWTTDDGAEVQARGTPVHDGVARKWEWYCGERLIRTDWAVTEGALLARLVARGWKPRGLPYDPRPSHAHSWPA